MNEVIQRAIARINRGLEMAAVIEDERAIEELKITREALIKQIPKNVIIENGWKYCPACYACLNDDYGTETNYCSDCGQRLEW